MKSLNEDIKTGQLKNLYLLYGEEDYLKRQYRDRLTRAFLPEGDTVNYAYYEGKGVPVKEIIDLAETMPFFAERRLIVIENSGLFKGAAPELADYIKELPETCAMIFVETETDKRGKLYKAVKAKGRAVELARQDERTLTLWLLGLIRQEGKRVQESTVRRILTRCGTDMECLAREMEKLFCYTMDREELTAEDVDAVCTVQTENRIFEMVDAVAARKKNRALALYYDLLALKEPPMRILYLLLRQFRVLLEVQALSGKGMGKKQIAQEAGLHPFAAGKYMEQCRNFSKEALIGIMEEGAELETDVKTGRLSDVMSVEILILSVVSDGGREGR